MATRDYMNAYGITQKMCIRDRDSKGDWVWNVGFNLSHVKNEILEMGGLEETISGQTINRIGNPIGAYFGYKAIGMNEEVTVTAVRVGSRAYPSGLLYRDVYKRQEQYQSN